MESKPMIRSRNSVALLLAFSILWITPDQAVNAQTGGLPHTVADGTVLEEIASGFNFVEGPVVNHSGDLFFLDSFPKESYVRIHKLDHNGDLTIYHEGGKGWFNGLNLDAQERLHVCEAASGRVTRMDPDGSITILADSLNGNRFNWPNDLAVTTDGSVYFTDSYFNWPRPKPQPISGVYRIAPGGAVTLVADFDQPNGIVLSEDETTLFITNDNPSGVGEIWAFDLHKDGTLTNKRLFATAAEVMDGMTLDAEGNLYAASFNNRSWLFSVDDILDWPGFCADLILNRNQDSANPGKRIWELLPPDIQLLIESSSAANKLSAENKTNIVGALNDLLGQKHFYREQDYANVDLPKNAQNLLANNQNRDDYPTSAMQRFNRLLIERSIYPDKLAKSQKKPFPSKGRGLWVFDPGGAFLGLIPTPEQPTNCTLAGNTLYVTTRTKVYSIRLNVSG
jgi:gluconolactonase